MSVAQMATASGAPSSSYSSTPTDSVTLRAASMATPLRPRRSAIIASRASALAAAVGSNAGIDEYITSRAGDTRSRRVTSPVLCNRASTSAAASEMCPRSSLTSAARNGASCSTIGVSSRIRWIPVSTIFPHSARLPPISVWSSCVRSNSSRWYPANSNPAIITAMKATTMVPMRVLIPMRSYSTTCAMRSRSSGG